MKKILALLVVAAAAFFTTPMHADAAPATPAVKSMASVVPPGCFSSASPKFDAKIVSTGQVVRSDAVSFVISVGYTTSGASVKLDHASYLALDDHVYNIQVHRWEKQGGTIFNGPGGQVDRYGHSWDTSSNLWLTTATPTPFYSMSGVDINRSSVGFQATFFPCP